MTRKENAIKQIKKDIEYFWKKIEIEDDPDKIDFYWAHICKLYYTIYQLLIGEINLIDL